MNRPNFSGGGVSLIMKKEELAHWSSWSKGDNLPHVLLSYPGGSLEKMSDLLMIRNSVEARVTGWLAWEAKLEAKSLSPTAGVPITYASRSTSLRPKSEGHLSHRANKRLLRLAPKEWPVIQSCTGSFVPNLSCNCSALDRTAANIAPYGSRTSWSPKPLVANKDSKKPAWTQPNKKERASVRWNVASTRNSS